MNGLVERVKSRLRRVSGWIGGDDVVPVHTEPFELDPASARAARRPAVDVHGNDDELLLVADVPGASIESTRLHVDRGQLVVFAQVAAEDGQPISGSDTRAWYAAFALPLDVDVERTKATLRDGVLSAQLPKPRRPAARRIPVETR
jgi:HSP20 family protein